MRLSVASVGPFLLPLALAAGAVWLGARKPATGFDERLRPLPGTLRVSIPTNPPNLDPVEATDTTSDGILERLAGTLIKYDPKLELVPDLAEAMPDVSEDGRTYTFRLRRGVMFHPWTDLGGRSHPSREVVAEDVRYSLTRLLEPWSKRAWLLDAVEGMAEARKALSGKRDRHDVSHPAFAGIEAPDPRTVRIRLAERNRYFPYFLAMNNTMVVPREAVAALGLRFGRQPVGTGPFRLVEWRDNHKVVFERFEGYHGKKPSLERVVVYVMPDQETTFQAYLNGDLEVIQAPDGKVRSIRDSNLGPQLTLNPLGDTRFHCINMERPPLGGNTEKADPPVPMTPADKERARKLRQAFNWAIDREFLVREVIEGRGVPLKGVLSPSIRGYDPDLRGYGYDPEKAKGLLAEAGYPGGKGLPVFEYHFNSQSPNPAIAQAIQEMLRRVGIETTLKQMDWGAYQNFVDEGKATFFRMGWIMDYPEAENFLYVLFHSKFLGSDGNYARTQNPEIDALLEKARAAPTLEEEMRLWRAAERGIVDEAPWVFLYSSATALLVKPYVKGVVFTPMDSGPEIQQVDLVEVRVDAGEP